MKKVVFLVVLLFLPVVCYAMTLSDIRTDVRSMIAETSTSYVTNAEINRWINQGMYEVAILAPEDLLLELQASGTQAITVGKTSYTIPSDMAKIMNVHTTTYECTLGTPQEATRWRLNTNFSNDQTKPFVWFQDNALNYYPASNKAGVLTIHYIKRPANQTSDTAACPLNPILANDVVYYATAKVALKIRAFDVAGQYLKLFYDQLGLLGTRMKNRNKVEESNSAGASK